MIPTIGDKLIINLKKDLMLVQQKAADLGYLDTANRVKENIASIMHYAVQKGIIELNPINELKESFKKTKDEVFSSIIFDNYVLNFGEV